MQMLSEKLVLLQLVDGVGVLVLGYLGSFRGVLDVCDSELQERFIP